MIKILLILGILLTFANDVSSNDEFHPISAGSDTIISSSNEKKGEVTDGSDQVYSDKEKILTESRSKIVPAYTRDWFWGDGEPLSPSDHLKMPKPLKPPDWIHKDNYRVRSHKKNKSARKPKKDEVLIISDHIRQNTKDEIIWTWGKVKIRMENKTIQADKIKIDNKTGEGVAKGNVILKNDDGTQLKANISRFNIKSKKGKSSRQEDVLEKSII